MQNIVEIIVDEANVGVRVDIFIAQYLDLTRTRVQSLIKSNDIKINRDKTKASYKLELGDKIEVTIHEAVEQDIEPQDIKLDIVYEDEHIAIVNKKAGMVVHPSHGHDKGTLVNAILFQIKDLSGINGELRPGIVHRLDKDTSGLIIVAKNDKSHNILSDMFKNKEIKKTYLAIVKGRLSDKEGRIETYIARDVNDRKKMKAYLNDDKGKLAITNYNVIDENEKYSLLEVKIETGRTHQIRVHMKYIGHPIVGDGVYGKASSNVKRQMLHAYNLEFEHPITKEKINVTSELPKDFIGELVRTKLQMNPNE